MNRFGVFYCDIYGTYLQKNMIIRDGEMGFYSQSAEPIFPVGKLSMDRIESLTRFTQALDRLCDVDGLDKLYFSFGSSSSCEEVKACIDEIKPYLKNYPRLKLGTSFAENEKFVGTKLETCETKGKHMQILHNIHKHLVGELHPEEQFVKYYFADDGKMNHIMLKQCVKHIEGNIDNTHFVLGESSKFENGVCVQNKNMAGLLEVLDEYCMEKSISVYS